MKLTQLLRADVGISNGRASCTVTDRVTGLIYYVTIESVEHTDGWYCHSEVVAVDSRSERRVKTFEPRFKKVMAVALFSKSE